MSTTINLSLSSECYKGKPTKEVYTKMKFKRVELTPHQLHTRLRRGHSYTYVANEDKITSKEKNEGNYSYTQIVSIDIDNIKTQDIDFLKSIERTLKTKDLHPHICYQTFTDNEERFTNTGETIRKCRLLYLFQDKLSKEEYKSISKEIGKKILQCTGEFENKGIYLLNDKKGNEYKKGNKDLRIDPKSYEPIQLFNGTTKNKKSSCYNEIPLYTKNQFTLTETKKTEEKEPIIIEFDKGIISDMKRLDFKEFCREYPYKFNLIYQTEPTKYINDTWAKIPNEQYISVPYLHYKIQKGFRLKTLFKRTCIRRYINNTPNDLLFSLFYDYHHHIEQPKNDLIEIDKLIKIVQDCFKRYPTIEDLKKDYPIEDYTTKNKQGYTLIFHPKLRKDREGKPIPHNVILSNLIEEMVGNLYDWDKTAKENYISINKMIKEDSNYIVNDISLRTIYNFIEDNSKKKKNSSKTKRNRLIHKFKDKGFSYREIQEKLQRKGIKVSVGTITNVIKRA